MRIHQRLPFGIVCIAIAVLAGCQSVQPVALPSGKVYSPALKVSLQVPPGWRVLSAAEVRAAQQSRASGNQELNYALYQYGSAPFVTLLREGTKESPTWATFYIFRESLGEERLASNERALALELGVYTYFFGGAHPVGPTVEVTVAGQRYAYNRLRYVARSAEGKQAEIERQFWVHAQGISAIVMQASYPLRHSQEVWTEIQQIVASIEPSAPPS